MQNEKFPGNDGLTKELYETFWNELKEILIDSVSETKEKGYLSASQRQAVIGLIEKKKIKRFIQNWTPILSVDLKIISKALSEKLKNLISTHQTAYVKNKHLGESGKLTSDIKEIARSKKFEAFLVKMDIEKSFDSLDHDFLISTLEKYGFGKNFILWVKTYLMGKEIRSCVLLTVAQLQSISHLGEVPIKVT